MNRILNYGLLVVVVGAIVFGIGYCIVVDNLMTAQLQWTMLRVGLGGMITASVVTLTLLVFYALGIKGWWAVWSTMATYGSAIIILYYSGERMNQIGHKVMITIGVLGSAFGLVGLFLKWDDARMARLRQEEVLGHERFTPSDETGTVGKNPTQL